MAAVVVIAVGAVAEWELRPRFPETDSRACVGSTVPIEQQAQALHLVLPRHVTQWHYDTSRFDPSTRQSVTAPARPLLRMEFRAGNGDILAWLKADGLPTPAPYSQTHGSQDVASGPACGILEDGFSDWSVSTLCTPNAQALPHAIRTTVDSDLGRRPDPVVFMEVDQVANCSVE